MKHMMIDLETLSSNSHAAVIQIGAVVFDYKDLFQKFKETIDFSDAMKYGEVSGSTLNWWMDQDDGARKSVLGGTLKLKEVLSVFNSYLDSCGPMNYWAHATFDFPVLMNAYDKVGLKPKLHYRKMRDLRTLEDFAGEFITWDKREGTHHDALDDACFQARHAQKMLCHVDTMIQRHKERDR